MRGGIKTGRVVGASDERGYHVTERVVVTMGDLGSGIGSLVRGCMVVVPSVSWGLLVLLGFRYQFIAMQYVVNFVATLAVVV